MISKKKTPEFIDEETGEPGVGEKALSLHYQVCAGDTAWLVCNPVSPNRGPGGRIQSKTTILAVLGRLGSALHRFVVCFGVL